MASLAPATSAAPVSSARLAGPLVAVAVLVGVLPSLPAGLHTWDNTVKLQVAWNLSRGMGPVLTEPTPLDEFYVARGRDGRHFANYPVLAALPQGLNLLLASAGLPIAEGLPFAFALAGLAWLLVAWGLKEGVPAPAAATGALLTTLGTALWPSAALGYDVVLEALALATLLWACAGGGSQRSLAIAGLAVGLVFAVRSGAAFLFFPSVAALWLSGPRTVKALLQRSVAFGLGALPGVAAALGFNAYRFGEPFTFYRSSGPWADVAAWFAPWFSTQHLEGLAGLWVSPGKGLLWYSPPLLVALFAVRSLFRRWPRAAWVLSAYFLGASLLVARLWFWHAEWCWGPRYLAPACLFAAPVGWRLWEWARGRLSVAVVLVAAAALLQVVPVVGEPVRAQFALVVEPLAAQGALHASNIHAPPPPDDNRVLYFEARHSMLTSVPRWLGRQVLDPDTRWATLGQLALAALAPLLGALALLRLVRRAASEA